MPPPDLMLLASYAGWAAYEDAIYAVYLETVARAGLVFRGDPVKVRYMPESKRKGCLRSHTIRKFTKERDAWRAAQKG